MKKSKLLAWLGMTILSMSFLLSGCTSGGGENTGDDPYAYLKKLDMNYYYVRHANLECEKVYFGNATFNEGNVVSAKNDSRVMWFKEDFENIPTLYKGDTLIYRTSDILTEEFVFERFEDFGYSIGICGLRTTTSGRYSISTDPKDNNTYPEGDTDELLLLKNEIVIMDSLGGLALRAPKDELTDENFITRIGSVKGLKPGENYRAEIYEGTMLNSYVFKADVILLGSMDVVKTTDYFFESETIIKITIPEEFNSGYYMINGAGIFRYVNGDAYDETTDFNIPNRKDGEENGLNNGEYVQEDDNEDSENNKGSVEEDENEDLDVAIVELKDKEKKTITVRFDKGVDMTEIYGYIVSPKGERYELEKKDNTLSVTIDVKTTGEYTVEIYNLKDESAMINIT